MTPLFQRVIEAEARMLTDGYRGLSWRVSEDVGDALAREAHLSKSGKRFYLIGYPARVDDSLPPNSLICDGQWLPA